MDPYRRQYATDAAARRRRGERVVLQPAPAVVRRGRRPAAVVYDYTLQALLINGPTVYARCHVIALTGVVPRPLSEWTNIRIETFGVIPVVRLVIAPDVGPDVQPGQPVYLFNVDDARDRAMRSRIRFFILCHLQAYLFLAGVPGDVIAEGLSMTSNEVPYAELINEITVRFTLHKIVDNRNRWRVMTLQLRDWASFGRDVQEFNLAPAVNEGSDFPITANTGCTLLSIRFNIVGDARLPNRFVSIQENRRLRIRPPAVSQNQGNFIRNIGQARAIAGNAHLHQVYQNPLIQNPNVDLPQGGCRERILDLICDPRSVHLETKRSVKGNSHGLVIDLNNLVVWCPNVKNNNCFFACIKYIVLHENKSLRSKYISHIVGDRVDSWRKIIGAASKCLIDLKHIATFVDLVLHRAILITDENLNEIAFIKPTSYNEERMLVDGQRVVVRDTKPLELVLFREHFFVLMRKSLQQFSCSTCGDRNIVKIEKHICRPQKVQYYQQIVKKHLSYFDKRIIQNENINDANLFENLLFFDFETFFNGIKHQVYAVGCIHKHNDSEKYFSFTGPNCMETFMMYLEEMQKQGISLTLISYNGCNFDHYFLLENALTFNTPLNEFLMNKGRLLQLNFMNHKVLDMYNFLGPSSLDSNCESYGIKVRKSIFPHLYARKWEDLLYRGPPLGEEFYPERMRPQYREWVKDIVDFNYMQECEKYLEIDVQCLKELTIKFIRETWNQFSIYVPYYITLSQLAFDMWRSTLSPLVKLPLPTEPTLYDMINKSTYGGRCHFVKRAYTSPDANKAYDDIQDYLVDWDVVSLYPSSMMSMEFPYGELKHWNTGQGVQYLNDLVRTHSILPIGIYEVVVRSVPNHMVIPPLPRKNDKGHTVWDNEVTNIRQCYTSIDLYIGMRYGYTFEVISAYTWQEQGELFTSYITDIFNRKAEQDVYKKAKDPKYNPAARDVFKKLMNALYGKLMQKRQITDHKFMDDTDEDNKATWLAFLDSHANVEYQHIGEQMFMTGDRLNYSETITKPHYLGAFILSHSRIIMNTYYDLIDEERRKPALEACWRTSLENSMYYTDTDSLIVHSSKSDTLKDHIGSELGKLSDELSGGKIIEGYFLSPKVYCVKYIMSNNTVHEKIRAKGIPNYLLNMQSFRNMYYDNDPTRYDFSQMRRLQEVLNSTHEKQNMEPFTIVSVPDAHRTLNPNGTYGMPGTLGGRRILENVSDSVPLGFQAEADVFDVLKLLEDDEDKEDYEAQLNHHMDLLYETLRTQEGIADNDFENYD